MLMTWQLASIEFFKNARQINGAGFIVTPGSPSFGVALCWTKRLPTGG